MFQEEQYVNKESVNNIEASVRRRSAEQDSSSSLVSFYEVRDVVYEKITDIQKKVLPKNWRITPRYELNDKEILQQETELFLSMTQEKRPEVEKPVTENDVACCVCWENVATRVVIPCGHRCLCYPCAYNIATNRSIFGGSRLSKLCPICQAAIGTMTRLC